FPGSLQIGYLSGFIQQFEWRTLKPVPKLLAHQPGDEVFNHLISLVGDNDRSTLLAYTPVQQEVKIRNPLGHVYRARWFDPVNNLYQEASLKSDKGFISTTPPSAQDYVLVLEKRPR